MASRTSYTAVCVGIHWSFLSLHGWSFLLALLYLFTLLHSRPAPRPLLLPIHTHFLSDFTWSHYFKRCMFTENSQMSVSSVDHTLTSSHTCDQLPIWHLHLYVQKMESIVANLKRCVFNMGALHCISHLICFSSV